MKNIFALTGFIFLMSCSIFKKDGAATFEEPIVKLTGTNWFLISLNNHSIAIDAEKPVQFKINIDNSFKGFAGCNQFWGVYKIMQSQISFSNFNRTKTSCDKIEIENELIETMRSTKAYLINGNKLQLINKNAEIIAVFQSRVN